MLAQKSNSWFYGCQSIKGAASFFDNTNVKRLASSPELVAHHMFSTRRIAHLDMDAFFASVELLRYPELRGHAVVIGGRGEEPVEQPDGTKRFIRLKESAGRGVVTTSTYPARAMEDHSGGGQQRSDGT